MRVVILGRDTALWLAAGVLARALKPSGITVDAIELPSTLTPADVAVALPPLEALHNQLRITEADLLRATGGAFSLGQNFAEPGGAAPAFLHAYGSVGAAIEGHDFFAYWLKARHFGLAVGLEDFSLTAAAARQGRMMIPDDDTEIYGRCDYGYHLPALAYAAVLKGAALRHLAGAHQAHAAQAELDSDTGTIRALTLGDGRRIEGDLFIDATGAQAELIGAALTVGSESWHGYFPADAVISASGPRLASIPAYAEIRATANGSTAIYPTAARTHVHHAYSRELMSDDEAFAQAGAIAGLGLDDGIVRTVHHRRRANAWERNCVAIGEAACVFDPVHGVGLHAIQLGLVNLLACFPAGASYAAQRAEYNRLTRSSFERVRDFQSAHYASARYAGAFWDRAKEASLSPELAHRIALFEARGEIAPMEEESFAPDSWRMLFTGHGLEPASWLPAIDRTSPDAMKAQFRRMLGFVREQVLRQPTHHDYLALIHG
jgi:tryptophan halogenase